MFASPLATGYTKLASMLVSLGIEMTHICLLVNKASSSSSSSSSS
jgi:hypothetical protein